MSLLFGILVIILILIFFINRREESNWEIICEFTGNKKDEMYAKYNYLKNNGVRCKINMLNSRGYNTGTGRSMFNSRNQETGQLKVYKQDLNKTRNLLKMKYKL